MNTLSPDLIACQGEKVENDYPDDLEDTLPNELIQFSSLLTTDIGKHVFEKDLSDEAVELRMFHLISGNNLQSTFPNVTILLKMYLRLMVTNCTGKL